ncbi:MAG: hypothetical protein ABSD27_06355 [Bryobacteraceae bacterium]|jgi:hypothetical protein
MSSPPDLAKLTVQEFAKRFRQEMIPVSNRLAYFSALPLTEDDIKEYLQEPVAALPPGLQAGLPPVSIIFVPYLARAAGSGPGRVAFERPAERSRDWSAQFMAEGDGVLVFALKDREVADYHYFFYRAVAALAVDHAHFERLSDYADLLRDELRNRVHGEADEEGWKLKQALLQKQSHVRRDTKLFRSYARQSLIDTLTLYLHGICCDIDVDTGPRQLPSRHLRRRLELLHDIFPPPEGYAVFPAEASRQQPKSEA